MIDITSYIKLVFLCYKSGEQTMRNSFLLLDITFEMILSDSNIFIVHT